jgi:hypothetical protein
VTIEPAAPVVPADPLPVPAEPVDPILPPLPTVPAVPGPGPVPPVDPLPVVPAVPPDAPAVPVSLPEGSELAQAARANAARKDLKTRTELGDRRGEVINFQFPGVRKRIRVKSSFVSIFSSRLRIFGASNAACEAL